MNNNEPVNMYCRHIFLFLFSITTFASYGQGYFHTRALLDSAALNNKQVIILEENDRFIIATTYTMFTGNLQQAAKEDKELLVLITQNNTAIIYADSIALTGMLRTALLSLTAALLQKGDCLVYNKLDKRTEKTITIEKYRSGAVKGRKFKNKDGVLILETRGSEF